MSLAVDEIGEIGGGGMSVEENGIGPPQDFDAESRDRRGSMDSKGRGSSVSSIAEESVPVRKVQKESSRSGFSTGVLVLIALVLFVLGVIIGAVIPWEGTDDNNDSGDSGNDSSSTQFAALPPDDAVLSKIAFGSCAKANWPQPFWDTLLSPQISPELFIFGGDNVYGDCNGDPQCAPLTEEYNLLNNKPSFINARSRLPMMAIPDDHDYGQNDCSVDNPYKYFAKDSFLNFFNIPADDPRRYRDGLYTAKIFGPPGKRVQVILLDTRWFKGTYTPTDIPYAPGKERYIPNWNVSQANTMLGDVQWTWFKDQLRMPADLRLVVSTVQILALGHGWERWMNFPLEVVKLVQSISDTCANGVVFVSGDRHIGRLYQVNSVPRAQDNSVMPTPYTLTEITSSSLTHTSQCYTGDTCSLEPDTASITPLIRENNIGVFDIDWNSRYVNISLVRVEESIPRTWNGDAGLPVASVGVNLDDLVQPNCVPVPSG
mmetsp:Transcript_12338/g.17146  ORF Transcript_12338/g.17146 Transcript_12338/m.17146 type:complete len:487 (+) Transcript_12338:158-1618(+)|eukprot:CAMPEP_0184479822 /NCGR_PEP_ID=MMETSP0113_2-20130426/1392_1 /TAXON_ID=91329 /ORGANISM="Norrisiella sphaerica, Strain BC52" /LENGTH=486 /DNA_ID=CAMNT_0026857979 /DNA_START=109 /DNA_END=1569 /DNA_ORIENTATION=+